MNGGTRVIAFGPGSHEAPADEILLTQEAPEPEARDAYTEPASEADEYARPVTRVWLPPALIALAIAAWSGIFAWAMQDALARTRAPSQWIELLGDWAVPVLLIAVVSLLALRNSRREALRFGDAARTLREESLHLEQRLTIFNRELSLAREFIASQSRDLEALGRLATERLSKESDRLQSLIRDNHDRVDAIEKVSTAALENMERLRGQLPVIASSAKDVTNNIGNAGRTAHAQLQNMVGGFQRLNEFGQASERQVVSLRGMVEQTLAEFGTQADKLGEIATQRFAALAEGGAEFRNQLETHEAEAMAAIHGRARAMAEELEGTRRLLDGHEAESLTSLRARLSALRDEGLAISRSLRDGEARAIEGWEAAIARLSEQMHRTFGEVDALDGQAKAAALGRVEEIAAEIRRLETEAAGHQDTAVSAAAQRRSQADRDHAEALDRLRAELAVFDGEMAKRNANAATLAQQFAGRIEGQLAQLDAQIEARRLVQEEQSNRITGHGEAVAARLSDLAGHLADVAAQGNAAEAAIARSLQTLTDKLAASRSALAGTDQQVATLTEGAVRLLELIQASVQHGGDDLPRALAVGEAQLSTLAERMAILREAAVQTGASGETLHRQVGAARQELALTLAEIERAQSTVTEGSHAHAAALGELRDTLEAIAGQSDALSARTRGELTQALSVLTTSANQAIAAIGQSGATAISSLAHQLGEESAAAIERAMRNSAAETSGQLEQAAAHAAGVSREAAIQMRDQLGKVNELTANLERRVAHARERAEEQVDNDFTRRVALITESLNSHAIDIAKALSTDVADTAWASYLRGDRGIFTRRAVALLDSGEAKAIAQTYERDRDFHDHVSRYIHDFEAMLRQVLSARDGHALGVTLLSSDMGKLYVALAQAIERLRS